MKFKKPAWWPWPRHPRPGSPDPGPTSEAEILQIARKVEGLLDGLASSIFADHASRLLGQDIGHIVPAVWGAVKNGELTADQKAIYDQAAPILKEAAATLALTGLTPAQHFAVGYMLRSLLISKIVYMIEATRRRRVEEQLLAATTPSELDHLEPIGRA